jgi:hypothetical protein
MSETPPKTVKETGAKANDVLVGIHSNSNPGLLVRVFESQFIGNGGRIRGAFRILAEGNGKYSEGIRAVIENNSIFEKASDFIKLVSAEDGCSDCTHILNANALWKLDVPAIQSGILADQANLEENSPVRQCDYCGRVYEDPLMNFCVFDGTLLSDDGEEVETVIRPLKTSRETRKTNQKPRLFFRANATAFIAQNFPELSNYMRRTSRMWEHSERPEYHDNWWFGVMKSDLENHEYIVFAGALDYENKRFKLLKVPAAYLRDNISSVDVTDEGWINLYIHMMELIDVRNSAHLPFNQFAIN